MVAWNPEYVARVALRIYKNVVPTNIVYTISMITIHNFVSPFSALISQLVYRTSAMLNTKEKILPYAFVLKF